MALKHTRIIIEAIYSFIQNFAFVIRARQQENQLMPKVPQYT